MRHSNVATKVLCLCDLCEAHACVYVPSCSDNVLMQRRFAQGIPGWNERLKDLQQRLSDALLRASPDFQDKCAHPRTLQGMHMQICSSALHLP